jgi:hypothetical protein
MRTPKILPWLAKRAGVSEEKAGELWRQAVREATVSAGWVGNSEYWGEAIERFRTLLAAEQASHCAPRVIPLVRLNNQILRLPLQVLEDIVSNVSAQWHGYGRPVA